MHCFRSRSHLKLGPREHTSHRTQCSGVWSHLSSAPPHQPKGEHVFSYTVIASTGSVPVAMAAPLASRAPWAALRAARTATDTRAALANLTMQLRGQSGVPLAPPSDARSLHPLLSALRHPETAVEAAVVLHALCGRSDASNYLVRGGAIGPLCEAASYSANYEDGAKLRGWGLAALAALARSVCGEKPGGERSSNAAGGAAIRQKLPEQVLPTLLGALQPSAPAECRAWAADAIATLIRSDVGASALAIRLGVVPLLAQVLESAAAGGGPADAASEASATSALGALGAVVQLTVGRARVLHHPAAAAAQGESEAAARLRSQQQQQQRSHRQPQPIVDSAITLLLFPALAPSTAQFLRRLSTSGGEAAALALLTSPSLPSVLPLLLAGEGAMDDDEYRAAAEEDDEATLDEGTPSKPVRASLVAITSQLLASSSSSAIASTGVVANCIDPSALDALRAAATEVLTRAAGSPRHNATCMLLKAVLSAADAHLPHHRAPSANTAARSAKHVRMAASRCAAEYDDDEDYDYGPAPPPPAPQPPAPGHFIYNCCGGGGAAAAATTAAASFVPPKRSSATKTEAPVADFYGSIAGAAEGWSGADSLTAMWAQARSAGAHSFNAHSRPFNPPHSYAPHHSSRSHHARSSSSSRHEAHSSHSLAASLPDRVQPPKSEEDDDVLSPPSPPQPPRAMDSRFGAVGTAVSSGGAATTTVTSATTLAAAAAVARADRRAEARADAEQRAALERHLLGRALEGCEARAASAAHEAGECREAARSSETRCDAMARAARESDRRAASAETARRVAEKAAEVAEGRASAAERVAASAAKRAKTAVADGQATAGAAVTRAVKEAVATAMADADLAKTAAVSAAQAEAAAAAVVARAEAEREHVEAMEVALTEMENRYRAELVSANEDKQAAEALAAEKCAQLVAAEAARKDVETKTYSQVHDPPHPPLLLLLTPTLHTHPSPSFTLTLHTPPYPYPYPCLLLPLPFPSLPSSSASHPQVREARKAAEAACRSAADAHARARASELAREDAASEHGRLVSYLLAELSTTTMLLTRFETNARAWEAGAQADLLTASSQVAGRGSSSSAAAPILLLAHA